MQLCARACLASLALASLAALSDATLSLGTGIYDATGPISGLLMMGMANPKQVGAGLHQRLRSRAFVASDEASGKRFAFVSLDAGMGGIVLKNRVVAELARRLPGLYTHDNVAISGTHTHSGPSGFLQDVIFQFAGSGFQPATTAAMVKGVVESIVSAHHNLVPGHATWAQGELDDSNINRSPTAYLENPAGERAKYKHDTDHTMTLLKLSGDDGKELGMFNWFAVHPTSMNNTNVLVSGDNKGYASYMFERSKNGGTNVSKPGMGPFVAAFASSNLGDVSPNTRGAYCRDTGLPCDSLHSTCNGKSQQCSSRGPGQDMFESTAMIGANQFAKAQELYEAATTAVGADVDFIHTYVTMPFLPVNDPVSAAPLGHLCAAAMGDAFASGTTDGPGMFDFTQGANSSNPFWHFIAGALHKVTPAEKACQSPKGILLPTGNVHFPHKWAPDVLPLQMLRLGTFVIIAIPTEMTTMAGRRLREHIKAKLVAGKVLPPEGTVVIAGLANGYADYTTTFEEYQQQRYEGGSTIFGPHQLNAYMQEFGKLADHMVAGTKPPAGTPPDDFSAKCGKGKTPGTDHVPAGAKHFGDVITQPAASYQAGAVAEVAFAGGNPLNDGLEQDSYMEVQRCSDAACTSTTAVAVDGDWETRVHVVESRKDLVLTTRTWHAQWYIPAGQQLGTYRITFKGTSANKPLLGGSPKFTPFAGTSATFTVTA